MTEPKKFDTDKPRYDLLPPKALGLLVDCLTYGAKKYDDYNWRKDGGIDPNRLFAATQRHLWAWKDGEVMDKESGLPHLAHAATNLLMMLDLASRPLVKIPNFSPAPPVAAPKIDDRVEPEPEPEMKLILGAECEAYYWISRCSPESRAYKAVVDPNDWITLDYTEDNLKFAESLSVMFEKAPTVSISAITLRRTPAGHKIRSNLMTSLSPEVIEILKSIHGQMKLKFKTEKEVWAFYRKFQNPPFFQEERGKFQLGNCFDMPKYSWPDEENNEEEYWYIYITSYGWGATNLLKTLGVI